MTVSSQNTRVRKQRLWQNLLLSALVFVALCAAIEIGTRLLVYRQYGDSRRGMRGNLQYEPYLIYTDPRFPPFTTRYPLKGSKYRVVLLGGSTMAYIDTIMVRDVVRTALGRDVDVINLARGGYISNQERVALVLYGIRLNPDLLISLDGANDIVEMTKSGRTGVPYLDDEITFAVNHPFLNVGADALRHSQFFNALLKLRERRTERGVQSDEASIRRAIENYLESLTAMAVVARGLGVPYIMVLQPYIHLRDGLTARERTLPDIANYAYRKEFMIAMFNRLDSAIAATPFPPSAIYINGKNAFDAASGEVFDDEVHLTRNGERLLMQHVVEAPQTLARLRPHRTGAVPPAPK